MDSDLIRPEITPEQKWVSTSPKLKDPRSFTIPCTIGGYNFEKALCDLGANINLMFYFVFKKLGLKEIKSTTVSL